MNILSTSGINNSVNTYKYYERTKKIDPLVQKKDKYSKLSSAWGTVSSKLSSLQSVLNDLKITTSSSVFNTKASVLSNSDFLSATATYTATKSAYSLRVNQLAKSDVLVSGTLTSVLSSGLAAGDYALQINSGDYNSKITVTLDGTETYQGVMDAISSAINSDKATVTSADPGGGPFNYTGDLTFDINGTSTTISYDYSAGKTYSEIVSDLVSQINDNVSGVVASNVNGNLQVEVSDSKNYISISDTGSLASSFGLTVTKEKGASGIVKASVFSPSTNNSKLSLQAVESGYDNRLQITDTNSILGNLGITSSILTNHTQNASDTDAGFIYDATSSTVNELNAKLTFNGINIQRNSNTVDDLVSGVTFSLKAIMEASDPDVSVNVDNDVSGVKSKIQSFIDKFNDAYSYLKSNYYSGESGRGLFVGDPSASSLISTLQRSVTGQVSGIASDKLNRLNQIGISFDPSTGLSISDSSTLESNIKEKADEVAAIFNSTNGIATSLYDTLDNYLGSSGSIARITESYDNNVSYYTDKITAMNERIDKSASILRKKYEELQRQYAQMLSLSSFFSSISGGYSY